MSNEKFTNSDTLDTVPSFPVKSPVKRRPGRPKGSGTLENLTPFTSERAKAISAKANEAKKARAGLRRRMLAAAVEAGLESQFMKALQTGDSELMNIVVQASRLTGADFSSSEEAVQKVKLNAETKSDIKMSGPLKFIIEDAVKTE